MQKAVITVGDTTMDDQIIYLEKLSGFSRLLRVHGLNVSPRETADAATILTLLGLEHRDQMKAALCTVFAKSREEQMAFDAVFDSFFISEEAMRRQAMEQMQQEQQMEKYRRDAQQELEQLGPRARLDAQQQETYMTMPEEVRKRLRQFTERYKDNLERNPELYGEFIHSVFSKTILEQQMLMEDAGSDCMASDPELGLLYRDFGEFRDSEIPKAIEIIQRIARQINSGLSSKRHVGRSGKLDFRRTIRKGLETGGSFRRLAYKRKRQHRKKLVILCDVSGSMVQFSEFALRFIQSLNQVSENSRIFLFSEGIVEADAFQLANMDSFRTFVGNSGIYGKGTDLGSALASICVRRPPVISTATTLLILSDTKTIDQNRAVQTLREARRLAGKVIWLNPIPEGKWKYLRSVQTMEAVVPMVCCSTLRELASACRKLTKV